MLLAQRCQLFRLARRFQGAGQREHLLQLGFQQQLEQGGDIDGRVRHHPAGGQQGQGGGARVADLGSS